MFHHTILKGEKSFLISVNKVFLACIKHQDQIFTAVGLTALSVFYLEFHIYSNVFHKNHLDVTILPYLICWLQQIQTSQKFQSPDVLKYAD